MTTFDEPIDPIGDTTVDPAGIAAATTGQLPIVPANTDTTKAVRKELRSQLYRSKTFIVGSIILAFWIFCAIFPDVIASQDPGLQDPSKKWLRPFSDGHWLGTDRFGRDVFSRAIHGAREILIVAPAATILGTIVGIVLGLAMGYFRGALDDVVSRIIEALMSLPVILVALLALTSLSGGRLTIILLIGFLFGPIIARTIRAAVLTERNLDYVRAAELRGERSSYVMYAEILPNVFGPIVVEFTVRLGYAVFTMAGLAFIGFGTQPGSPDWGRTIYEERSSLLSNVWWPALVPALCLASLVVAINLLADAIQGLIDR
ncbi:MAG: ABC transporter permease [Ilumatobacteraceae bacterium]